MLVLYKRSVQKIFLFILLVILSIGLFNYLVDPYGYKSRNEKFIKNLTMFNKPHVSVARINSEGEFYLIGSSRMARVSPQIIESISGKKTHNVKIDGATLPENLFLARKVKEQDKFFIFSFDAFSSNTTREKYEEIQNRTKLYKNEFETTSSFTKYFNSDITLRSIQHLIKYYKKEDFNKQFLDENSRFTGFNLNAALVENGISNNKGKSNFSNFESYSPDLIIQLANLATKDDIFIILPKHHLFYSLFSEYQGIEEKYLNLISLLVSNTDAQVWSFYGENKITKNENNFIDNGWHFKPEVSNIIFNEVLRKNINTKESSSVYLVNKENLEQYLNAIKIK
jgi:hypothetical protein